MDWTAKEMTPEELAEQGIDVNKCIVALAPVRDALYVLNGKWKLAIIIAIMLGNNRFGDIKKAVEKISSKVLSSELKDLELNGFLIRKVLETYPVGTEYVLTDYSITLGPVLQELQKWGLMHRQKIMQHVGTTG